MAVIHNSMLMVDGVKIKTPSVFQWSINEVSAPSAGRATDGKMYKERVTRKRKINLQWNGTTPAETKAILSAFQKEYFKVQYWDALAGRIQVRTFYSGDQTAPIKQWTVNNKIYEQVSFDIIER